MAYKRRTRDTWQIWCNYGHGWEHECTELSRAALRENVRAYRQNSQHPFKVITKRERIESGENNNG